jgi:predicted transcriptional regulator
VSLAELLFELASDDRLRILSEIEKGPLRLSDVSKRLSATVQETSRQLERLVEARLVSKGPESRYETTALGKVALSLLPSFRFVEDERDFVLSHDVSLLPPPFIHRLGELSERRDVNHLDEVLAHSEEVIKGAKKYVWLMADQSIRQSFPHEHPPSVEFRLILPKDISPEEVRHVRGRVGPGLQVAEIDRVPASIAMNETTAAVYFPGLDGRMDLTRGFASEDPEFHGWCKDLYSFCWSRGREGFPT